MNSAIVQHDWAVFLKFYGEQNSGRKTRLGVFEKDREVVTDYWLESDLPLVGIDLEARGGLPIIEIQLENYTHVVKDAVSLELRFTADGSEDGIDITDSAGKVTILRFENS